MSKLQMRLFFCLVVLAVGIWRFQIAAKMNEPADISRFYNQQISFEAIIEEPEQRINQQKFQVKALNIEGKILITTELYPQYYYGDKLKISGKLQEPPQFEDFDYPQYLAKDRIYLVSYYPKIELLASNQGQWFYQKIFNFKNRLRKNIEQALLPPYSSVLKAIFLGDKFGLTQELKEEFSRTGTRHIAAISGMHLVIMSQILLYLALALGLWRGQAFYFVMIILVLYILIVGAPASAVRAGIMAGLLLLAQKSGRLYSGGRAVFLAGALMLAVNPILLKADIGFQLSFAATLSIIYLKPIFDQKTFSWPNPWQIKDILSMTLAAQIGTLPLLIYHFGQVSLISPLANLLVVPIAPLIMISGLVLSLSGLVWLSLAKIFGWLVWFLLSYLIIVVKYLARFPGAMVEIKSVSVFILILYYLGLFYVIQKAKA